MSDGAGGATGILGVMVGVMLVIFIGAAFLYAGGRMGGTAPSAPSFTIKLPNAK
jgi:hypothetical protein